MEGNSSIPMSEEDFHFKINSLAAHLSRLKTICTEYKDSLEFTQYQVETFKVENADLKDRQHQSRGGSG